MDEDETEVTPTAEATPDVQESPQPETEETTEVVETDELDDLLKQAVGSDEDSPELVDVEYEGEQFKLPPKLKDALLRQSDYTKKTMEVAELRKAVEAKQAEIETVHKATNDDFAAVVGIRTLEAQIEQYSNLDTSGWTQEDINSARLDLQELTRQRDSLQFTLSHNINARQQQESQQKAKLRADIFEKAAKEVPNFSQQRQAELETLAVALGGIPEEDAKDINYPGVYKILHYADIGRKFVESRSKVASVKAAQQAAPVPEVGGKSAAGVDPNKMSTEEWMKHRQKQLAKK